MLNADYVNYEVNLALELLTMVLSTKEDWQKKPLQGRRTWIYQRRRIILRNRRR